MKCKECGQDVPEKKQTAGQKWAQQTIGAEDTYGPPEKFCSDAPCSGIACEQCRLIVALAYDQGHADGYKNGVHDEAGYTAQFESQQPKPEPAMTAEEWWAHRSVLGDTEKRFALSAVRDFRSLNKERVIT